MRKHTYFETTKKRYKTSSLKGSEKKLTKTRFRRGRNPFLIGLLSQPTRVRPNWGSYLTLLHNWKTPLHSTTYFLEDPSYFPNSAISFSASAYAISLLSVMWRKHSCRWDFTCRVETHRDSHGCDRQTNLLLRAISSSTASVAWHLGLYAHHFCFRERSSITYSVTCGTQKLPVKLTTTRT